MADSHGRSTAVRPRSQAQPGLLPGLAARSTLGNQVDFAARVFSLVTTAGFGPERSDCSAAVTGRTAGAGHRRSTAIRAAGAVAPGPRGGE